jgi:ribosomal subunit interface protein
LIVTTNRETTIEVSHHGDIDQRLTESLIHKVERAAAHYREDVRRIEVRLTFEANQSRHRPASVEVTLDVDGSPVRAHVAAATMAEAVDLVIDRLTRRLDRHGARRRRRAVRHHAGDHGDGERRPEYRSIPSDERETRRRKTFLMSPITVEEAIFDLDQVGHDFYLFVEEESGRDAVVSRIADFDGTGPGYELRAIEPASIGRSADIPGLIVVPLPAPVLDPVEAQEYLETSGEKFLFHRSPDGRGQVLYRRYDGHNGLISPR